jgi:hypothetical protein
VTPEEFKRHGHELIDWIADYVENIEQQRVTSEVRPGDVRAQLDEHPPATPDGFDAVMADTNEVVVPGLTHWQHPSFFAYFPANSSYPAILGDLLTAGLGVQGMSWVTSPACTEIETLMVDWMQELLDLPPRVGQRGDAGIDPCRSMEDHQRLRQQRRRHLSARRVRNVPGSLEHRKRVANRRDRHGSTSSGPARREVRHASAGPRRDGRG